MEELPNGRIEEYKWGLGIRLRTGLWKGRKRLGPFGEIQVQPDGTIIGTYYPQQREIVQVVLPNGAHTDRYHSITFLGNDPEKMVGEDGALKYLLSRETGRRISRGYHKIIPTPDGFYRASFGTNEYILDENGHVVASKMLTMPWKKRKKDVDLNNHLFSPFKNPFKKCRFHLKIK